MSYEEVRENLCLAASFFFVFLVVHEGVNAFGAPLTGISYIGKRSLALDASGPTSVTCRADLASSTG